ncbi:hypothetical protein GCM10022280_22260 [Sphingomonas swuensis]|uniref:DUF4336 domain-containing protein n=2 Tax=Sphingomonas swuensis TaxID=977800 RepID=A0ABP7T559_9SPHN
MTIIRTKSGLMLYSPVRLTEELAGELTTLGSVSAIIAPNLYHHMFLRDCAELFSDARIHVPLGLEDKIGKIHGAEVIAETTRFASDVEQFTVTGHGLRETILYHAPSATLITADLLYNYAGRQFPAENMWFKLVGCYGKPDVAFYHRFSIKNLASLISLLDWVTARDVKRVVMSHGDILYDPAAGSIFVQAWKRLLRLED